MSTNNNTAPPPDRSPAQRRSRGPVSLLFALLVGLVLTTIASWLFATVIEIGGMYTLWKGQGAAHARAALEEDYGYIRGFPRSLIVRDTEGFARRMAGWGAWPFEFLRTSALVERARSRAPNPGAGFPQNLFGHLAVHTAEWVEAAKYAAQDTMVRLAIALYGLPAFAMALTIGLTDGLVRRDLRKWGGGRESSFLYHHSKRFTGWFLTVGFGAYLAWPFGGLNPAYMVLVFAAAVALALSTAVSSFKKYL